MAGVPDLEFRALGVLEVLRAGEPVAVGKGSTLNLMAGLVVSANSAVSADALAELIWDGNQPAHARAALHNKISRLRQRLGEELIETTAGAYRLRVSAGQLDLLRFDELAGAAANAATDGDVLAALEQAIGLWRGTPLSNVGSAVLQREAVPALTERYLMACEQWAAVCLRLGRPDAVAARLGPLAAAHPFRETLVEQLMLALCWTRRHADALAAYERVRHTLREELGADPGPAVQELHVRILRNTVEQPETGPRGPRVAASAQPRWGGRGPAPGPLVGRDGDQQALAEALGAHHGVTVVGPAGVGKTELTLQTAKQVAAGFAEGVFVAELGTLPAQRTGNLEAVSAVLLAALGLAVPPAQSAWEALLAGLRPRELLLVLDNAEHVSVACSRLVDLTVRSCPQVRVITTSRRPLGFGGERVFSVAGLNPAAAAELLRLRVAERGGGDVLTADPDSVVRLCQVLDGLPLAIELAAARLGTMSLRSLIDRITARPDLLVIEGRPGLAHQRGLVSTLRWSYDLIGRSAQLLLTRLAVFAGAFSLEDAERVCGFAPLAEGDVAGLLSRLAEDSLLQITSESGDRSYRLLVPVRELAISLAGADDRTAARASHLRYLCATAEQIETTDAESASSVIEWLLDRYPELIAALEWSLSVDAPDSRAELGARLLVAAKPVWGRLRGAIMMALGHTARALGRQAALPPSVVERLMLAAGEWYFRAGDLDAAKPLLEQVSRRLGDGTPQDRRRHAQAMTLLAGIAYSRVEPGAAEMLRQSADDARKTGDQDTIVFQLSVSAAMLSALGHLDEALDLIDEAGEAAGGPSALRLKYLARRAYVYLRVDRVDEAMADIDEVLADRAAVPTYDLVETLLHRGYGLAKQGNLAAARDTLNQAMRLAHEVQTFTLLPDVNEALALTEDAAGNLPQAVQHVREVLQWALPLPAIIDIVAALHLTVALAAKMRNPRAAQIAADVYECRLRSGLTTWPFTARQYARYENILGVGTPPVLLGPLRRDAVIRTAKLALKHVLIIEAKPLDIVVHDHCQMTFTRRDPVTAV